MQRSLLTLALSALFVAPALGQINKRNARPEVDKECGPTLIGQIIAKAKAWRDANGGGDWPQCHGTHLNPPETARNALSLKREMADEDADRIDPQHNMNCRTWLGDLLDAALVCKIEANTHATEDGYFFSVTLTHEADGDMLTSEYFHRETSEWQGRERQLPPTRKEQSGAPQRKVRPSPTPTPR